MENNSQVPQNNSPMVRQSWSTELETTQHKEFLKEETVDVLLSPVRTLSLS